MSKRLCVLEDGHDHDHGHGHGHDDERDEQFEWRGCAWAGQILDRYHCLSETVHQ